MSDLKICRICLRTEAKMYKYDQYHLKYYYEEVMAVKVDESDGLPKYYCYECATILHKFHKFKEKCYIGQKTLRQLLWKGPITYESVYKIDRASINLKSPLSIMTLTNSVKKYVTKEINWIPVVENVEPISSSLANNTLYGNQLHADSMITEHGPEINDEISNKEEITRRPTSPETIFVDIYKEAVKLESEPIKDKKYKRNATYKKFLNSRHWRIITLKEEEALKEFRSKAESKRYVEAAYKCHQCFRGFSKEDMLRRHTLLRHTQEGPGLVECRFCHMRFKYKSFLTKHMAQHYVRYECLRCQRICPFQTSALMHEEYHSGVTNKCIHCDEEFRHRSTYYSHLRTHRGVFPCVACGRAFFSRRGLDAHRHLSHPPHPPRAHGSTDEEEWVADSDCAKCGVRFRNREAFQEHLFQSAAHAHGGGENKDSSKSRKILGKKEKAKVINELRQRDVDPTPLASINTKRRKKQKRNRKKPTQCHQCGLQFPSQAACRRHHVATHPRTSFFAPSLRHVCELCGAVLAPGSVGAHRNMHSRQRLFPCDRAGCPRQFHSAVGLRRHRVTHTGERPYPCPLCEKRFTQSNSMKLHYRTFHLKEPYPKRNRRKKKPVASAEQEGPEAPRGKGGSDPPGAPRAKGGSDPAGGIAPLANALNDNPSSTESMHYMPL